MFEGDNLTYELLLITRQNIELRNAFNNNMQAEIKLFKARIFKIAQYGGFLGSLLCQLAGPFLPSSFRKKFFAPLGITAAAWYRV